MADFEPDQARLDIETLRTIIDVAVGRGAAGDSILVQACEAVLRERRTELARLERADEP